MKYATIFVILVLSLSILAGCKDITDSFKPGSFGKTAEETAMVDAITQKYGDMTADGEPRLLEAMMTSSVHNFIPVDKVSKYSKDSTALYVWFVYDNFDNDVLDIEWTYLDTDHSIHTFQSETGEDFGRGTFILEQPDDGWPLGNYEVVISGRGVSTTVPFAIVEGKTVSTPLDILLPGTLPADVDEVPAEDDVAPVDDATPPGWYQVEVIDNGDDPEQTHDYYTYGVTYARGDITTSDIGDEGETAIVETTWTEPPVFIAAEQELAIEVTKKAVNMETDGLGLGDTSSIKMDTWPMEFGYATSSAIGFEDETYGEYFKMSWKDSTGSVKKGVFKAIAPGANAWDGKMEITFQFQNGPLYGTKYRYEWRE